MIFLGGGFVQSLTTGSVHGEGFCEVERRKGTRENM